MDGESSLKESIFVIPEALDALVPGPVMHIPVTFRPGTQSFYQTLHRQPITYGYLARTSQQQRDHVRRLEAAVAAGGDALVAVLDELQIENLLITKPLPHLEFSPLRALATNVVALHPQSSELVAVLGDPVEGEGALPPSSRPAFTPMPQTFRLPKPATAGQIDVQAQVAGRYLVELRRGQRLIGTLPVPHRPLDRGLHWRVLEVPEALRSQLFDAVVVRPDGKTRDAFVTAVVISR